MMRGMDTPAILLIEDQPHEARLIRAALHDHFGVDRLTVAAGSDDARTFDLTGIDLVLSKLGPGDGADVEQVSRLLDRRCDLPIVMLTTPGGHDLALDAIRRGAYDYVVQAGDYLDALPVIIEKNLAIWRTKRENARLHHQLTDTLDDLRRKNQQLESVVAQLRTLVSTDPLTNLANRRAFNEALDRMFDEAVRYDGDLACVMIDLDRFKMFNDTRGHQDGDELLRRVGRVLRVNCRQSDVAARFGGDEFVLLLPRTDAATAARACTRISEEFAVVISDLAGECGDAAKVTMSVGIASLRGSSPGNPRQLIAHADTALYQAKQTRLGQVVVYEIAAAAA
jgi:diguanylate cyclase (GGDEF)-like protein